MRAAKGLAALVASLAVFGSIASAVPTPHKSVRCAGRTASVLGTEGADVIRVKPGGGHVVAGLGGADRIVGTRRGDVICGGYGNDRIATDGGADRIIGGAGTDKISAGSGADLIRGGRDADRIAAGAGADRIDTGGAKDSVTGGSGNDILIGLKGNDRLSGGPDADRLEGGVGDDRLRGGIGDDVLSGADGTDRMNGGDGNDQVTGDAGPDLLAGGGGDDSVFAGEGGDIVDGGDGEDLVLGSGGGDRVDGGRGSDRIYGELVDDTLLGGPGDDLISGGHGFDQLDGGPGDDFLRGDTNLDYEQGGPGSDTVSYATATPPGPEPGTDGVLVDLPNHRALEDPKQALRDEDDPAEFLGDIENVVGSGFGDDLRGVGTGFAQGLGGSEACSGFASPVCDIQPPASIARASMEGGSDPGLLVQDAEGGQSSSFALSVTPSAYVVSASVAILAGPGCTNSDPTTAACPKPPGPLGYVTAWGGGGSDQLALGEGFPSTAVVVFNGGEGDDRLLGSSGEEVLLAGPSGSDILQGAGGGDALFSGPGGDILDAGDGSDQLVTSTPCDGHDFRGGGGDGDIAGFAQTIDHGIVATLGGTAVARGISSCNPTLVRADNEILEGTQNDDILYGNGRSNALILGNEGDDVLFGGGGADALRGEQGHDTFFGGGGRDRLEAFDGTRDTALHCGAGGDTAQRDRIDPPASHCGHNSKRGHRGHHKHRHGGKGHHKHRGKNGKR